MEEEKQEFAKAPEKKQCSVAANHIRKNIQYILRKLVAIKILYF